VDTENGAGWDKENPQDAHAHPRSGVTTQDAPDTGDDHDRSQQYCACAHQEDWNAKRDVEQSSE
jgi:hypothetical protein